MAEVLKCERLSTLTPTVSPSRSKLPSSISILIVVQSAEAARFTLSCNGLKQMFSIEARPFDPNA